MPGLSSKGWIKMIGSGAILCIGGPALVMYVMPTEEELFKRYNPELQKRSIENRQKTQEDFDAFVNKLKTQSRSKQNIWVVQDEEQRNEREAAIQAAAKERQTLAEEIEKRKQEIRNSK